jgi:chitin disaccharide deacetylase
MRPRRFRLCADDYGISPAVNRAIRDLIGRGRINATSVMVGAPSFDAGEARALIAVLAGAGSGVVSNPGSGATLGLHLTLTAPFRPLSPYRPVAADGAFLSLRHMLARGLGRALDGRAAAVEAERQIDAFLTAFGRPPDFVDGHQHMHLLPQVGDALLAVMKERTPAAWVRQCGRTSPLMKRRGHAKAHLLDVLSRRMRRRCAMLGVATNPGFAGAYNFKRDIGYDVMFASFLEGLPEGGVVMCHPGFVDAELERLDHLTAMREQEYAFFAGERFPQLLAERGFALA